MSKRDLLKIMRPALEDIKPYVPGKPIDEVKREIGIEDVIKLASNENPLGPSPKAIRAIVDGAAEVHYYPDGSCYSLRKALSEHLGVKPENILFGAGLDEVLRIIAESFIDPGDEVIYGTNTFSQYEFVTRITAGSHKVVPLKDYAYDPEAILEAIGEKTKLIFLCNPNNPTGAYVSKSRIDKLVDGLPEGVILALDEAYYEYVESPDYPNSIEDYVLKGKNVIALRTFSKIYGLAGLRLGYAVAVPEIISIMERVRAPFNVVGLAQRAAIAALTDQEHVKRSKELNSEGKRYLYKAFEEMGLEYIPSEANFVLVNTALDSKEVFRSLMRQGVIVRSGDIFGLPTWIRVSIGTMEQNKRFIEALKRVLGV